MSSLIETVRSTEEVSTTARVAGVTHAAESLVGLGYMDQAQAILNQFLEQEPALEYADGWVLLKLAWLRLRADDHTEVLRACEALCNDPKFSDDFRLLSDAHLLVGHTHHALGDEEEMLRHYELAISLARRLTDSSILVNTLSKLGPRCAATGHIEAAERYLSEAIALSEAEKNEEMIRRLCAQLGEVYLANGDSRLGLKYLARAVRTD